MIRLSILRFANIKLKNLIYKPLTTMDSKHLTVIHDVEQCEFYIKLKNEETRAVLQYKLINPNTLDMFHTEVPSEFQRQGIAGLLAKTAFDYVCENDMKMHLSCTYLQKYIKDHPESEYTSRVVGK